MKIQLVRRASADINGEMTVYRNQPFTVDDKRGKSLLAQGGMYEEVKETKKKGADE